MWEMHGFFPFISDSIGKCSKEHPVEKAWDIDTHTMFTLLFHRIRTLWYSASHGKYMGFLLEFLIAWENVAKFVLWEESGISILILLKLWVFLFHQIPVICYTASYEWYIRFSNKIPLVWVNSTNPNHHIGRTLIIISLSSNYLPVAH